MPVTKYQYDIATQTANGKVYIPQLTYEIDTDAAIAIKVDANRGMDTNVEFGKLDIYMADLLTALQETALTAAVLAHQGVGIDATMQGTLSLVQLERSIVSDVPWEVVEGVVTTPSFFDPDMAQIIARITGEHKGDGGQLQIVEDVSGEVPEDKIVPAFDFPNVGAVWTRFKVDSTVPPRDALRNVYRTEARRNGAASLDIRYASISMVVVRIV
jgi:hypothetical protein